MASNQPDQNILIVDSGSSRTRWIHVRNGEQHELETEGLNFYHMIHEDRVQLFWDINDQIQGIPHKLFFYGAGYYAEESKEELREDLDMGFGPDTIFEVSDDLTGAARGLLGAHSGVTIILGTGSNSGYYDGQDINERQVSLGFMIGDEGSGSDIGTHLIRDYFYGVMPKRVSDSMNDQFDMERDTVLHHVHSISGKRYAADFARITSQLSDEKYITDLLTRRFKAFIEQHLLTFKDENEYTSVALTGSFGVAHKELFKKILYEYGFDLKRAEKEIIGGLVNYHTTNVKNEH